MAPPPLKQTAKTHRPKTNQQPSASNPTLGSNPIHKNATSSGRGNGFANSMLPSTEPPLVDKSTLASSLWSDQPLDEVLTAEGQEGIEFDNSDPDANRLGTDLLLTSSLTRPGGVATVDKLRLANVDRMGVHAEQVYGDGIRVLATPVEKPSVLEASVDAAGAKALRAPKFSADSIDLTNLSALAYWKGDGENRKIGHARVTVGAVNATGVVAGDASAASLAATDVYGDVANERVGEPLPQTEVSGGASSLEAKKVKLEPKGSLTRVKGIETGKLGFQGTADGHGEASVDDVNATGLASATWTKNQGGVDPGVVAQVVALVRDLDAKVTVPLVANSAREERKNGSKVPARWGRGLLGKFKVAKGNHMVVSVKVTGGKLVPEGTGVVASDALDTALFTALDGVYLTEDGKVYLDIKRFPNINVTKKANLALGQDPDATLQDDLPALVNGAMTTPPGDPAYADAVDKDNISANAKFTLGGGTIQQGGVKAKLPPVKGGQGGTLEVDKGGKEVAASFARLVLDALQFPAGDATVDVKNVKTSGTKLGSKQGPTTTQTDASASELSAGQVRVKR